MYKPWILLFRFYLMPETNTSSSGLSLKEIVATCEMPNNRKQIKSSVDFRFRYSYEKYMHRIIVQ